MNCLQMLLDDSEESDGILQLPATEADDVVSPRSPSRSFPPGASNTDSSIPDSPPPSFRSRASSRRNSAEHRQQDHEDNDRTLDDAFAAPSDEESDNDEPQDSQRLVRNDERPQIDAASGQAGARNLDRRVTEINMFMPGGRSSGRVYGGGSGSTRDGVFANISAKPTRGEELEEKPPVCHHHILEPLASTYAVYRPTNKQPPTPHLRTGRPPSWPQAHSTATISLSTVSSSAHSSLSSGML